MSASVGRYWQIFNHWLVGYRHVTSSLYSATLVCLRNCLDDQTLFILVCYDYRTFGDVSPRTISVDHTRQCRRNDATLYSRDKELHQTHQSRRNDVTLYSKDKHTRPFSPRSSKRRDTLLQGQTDSTILTKVVETT